MIVKSLRGVVFYSVKKSKLISVGHRKIGREPNGGGLSGQIEYHGKVFIAGDMVLIEQAVKPFLI